MGIEGRKNDEEWKGKIQILVGDLYH